MTDWGSSHVSGAEQSDREEGYDAIHADRNQGTLDSGCARCGASYAEHNEDAGGRPAGPRDDGWRTLPEADQRSLRMTRCLYRS